MSWRIKEDDPCRVLRCHLPSEVSSRNMSRPRVNICSGLNGGSRKYRSMLKPLEPGTVTFGKKVLGDVIKSWVLRQDHPGLPGGPQSSDKHPSEKQARGGGGDVKMEAKVGGMWPQAREHLEPPKAGRGKDGLSP